MLDPIVSPSWVTYWAKQGELFSTKLGATLLRCAHVDTHRNDVLGAHDFGRSLRGVSLHNSGIIPQVPSPQYLFTVLSHDQHGAVCNSPFFRPRLQRVRLFLLLYRRPVGPFSLSRPMRTEYASSRN